MKRKMNNKEKQKRAEQLKRRLLNLLQDSKQASDAITGFFKDVGSDYITLRIINMKSFGNFDPDAFLERIKNTKIDDWKFGDPDSNGFAPFPEEESDEAFDFEEWVENNQPIIDKGIPIPDDSPEGEWLRETLETEHHKNRAKRIAKEKNKSKSHPMERLKNSKDDNVGIFPIGYVEYLEKQNDLLRKNNPKSKGGKNGKRKNTKKND